MLLWKQKCHIKKINWLHYNLLVIFTTTVFIIGIQTDRPKQLLWTEKSSSCWGRYTGKEMDVFNFNTFMPSGLLFLNLWTGSCPIEGYVLLLCFIEIPVFHANSVTSDQTPRSAASDLGLHFCQYPFYGTLGINVAKASTMICCSITKTCLFKTIDNFPTKKGKFSDKKFWYYSHFCSKHRLWVLVRTASTRRF